jgi:hypothetical protein
MFYILDKVGRIIGSADGPVDVEDLSSRGESMVTSELDLSPDRIEVVGFPTNPVIVEKKLPTSFPKIILTTTAKDTDGDGLPEILADGKSKASITATLQDAEGKVIQDPIEVHFRTSAGRLSRRSVTAQDGQATVQLTASRETVMASVSVFAKGFEPVNLDLEFGPPEK